MRVWFVECLRFSGLLIAISMLVWFCAEIIEQLHDLHMVLVP